MNQLQQQQKPRIICVQMHGTNEMEKQKNARLMNGMGDDGECWQAKLAGIYDAY